MEKTWLDRAISNNKLVTFILKDNPVDEYYLSNCCFFMQQAIEYTLEFILEKLSIDFRRTHNIATLINNIESEYPFFLEELKDKADKITEWESKSRYVLDFKVTKMEILDIQRLFELLLNEIEYNINYIHSSEYEYCYDELKRRGYHYKPDISNCMEDMIHVLNINQPYTENIYAILKDNIDDYFNNTNNSKVKSLDTWKKEWPPIHKFIADKQSGTTIGVLSKHYNKNDKQYLKVGRFNPRDNPRVFSIEPIIETTCSELEKMLGISVAEVHIEVKEINQGISTKYHIQLIK